MHEDDWGFAEFAEISALRSDGFMPDGNLHVKVKLKVKIGDKYERLLRPVNGYVGLKWSRKMSVWP